MNTVNTIKAITTINTTITDTNTESNTTQQQQQQQQRQFAIMSLLKHGGVHTRASVHQRRST